MKGLLTMQGSVIRKILRTVWASLAAFLLAAAAGADEPPDGAAVFRFSETEKRFVQARRSVRVGLIAGFEPYMFIGDEGSFQGIISDYLRLLEARTGIVFQAAPLDLAELDAAMGVEIDLFPGLESAPRRRRMAFTKPLFSDPWVLVNQRDAPLITGVRDLEGKTVSLVDGIYIHERLAADYPDIRIRPAKDHSRALASVMTGQADAYIGPLSVAGYLMLGNRLTHLKIAAPSGYPPAEVKFGVRNDWRELVGILDKAISTVTRREMDAIFRKWVPVRYERYVDWTHVGQWIAGIVAGFSILLAVSLWWNRKLSAEIAERRRAEEELMKSQTILKKTEELSDIGGYEYDISSGRLVLSDGWMKIHGCEHRTLSVDELMPIAFPEDVPNIEKAFDKALRNIEPYQLEHRIVRKDDGEVRVIQANAEVIFDDAARPVKMYGSVQDITERKAADQALKDSEGKLQAILNSAEQSFVLVDRNGAILAFNRITDESAKKVFGRGFQAGQPLTDFVLPGQRESFDRHFQMALEGEVVEIEKDMPGGHWFSFTYNPVRNAVDEVTGVCFNSREITDRKKAEASLEKERKKLFIVLDSLPAFVCLQASDYSITFDNKNFRDMFGEHQGRPCYEVIAGREAPCPYCPTFEVFKTGEPRIWEWTSDAGRTYMVYDSLFPDEYYGEEMVLEVGIDITDRKKAETRLKAYSERLEEMVEARTRELEKAQEELLLKERLAVLGNLSGSISHEIRNPLAAIDSAAYLLKIRLGEDGGNVRDQLQIISDNIRKATGIIESLLNLTRMEKPRTRVLDLREVVSEVLRGDRFPEMIRIETSYPEAEVPADVDEGQIRMALKNIVQNAIQAMAGDGTLSVSVQRSESGQAAIVVSDTGPGIPPDERERIFQPLFSTKVHGIGFGLSIAKMILEKHGGDLTVESAPGGGTAFTLALPGTRKEAKDK